MSSYVISISREFGSGGRMVGKHLAQRLGIPCYDRSLIMKTAEKSGLSPEFIAQAERSTVSRFHISVPHIGIGTPWMVEHHVPIRQQAFVAQAQVIRELADEGPCVVVGRCSDYVLGEDPNCLKVFIHADMEKRMERCATVYGLPEKDLRRRILETDRTRSNYYSRYTGYVWGDMRRYDLTIDAGVLGVEGAVEIIVRALAVKHPDLFHEIP